MAVTMDASPSLAFKTLKHDAMVWSAAFSPDGTRIVTGSASDSIGKVRLWDRSGEPLTRRHVHGVGICFVAFSPDSSCFASCDKDGTSRLWSAADGQPLFAPLQHRKEVLHAAFHPSESWLATASGDKTVRFWDWTTGQAIAEPLQHPREVIRVRFSADGRWLLAHIMGKRIAVWTLDSGDPACVWFEHPTRISTAAFSPDGRLLLTGCGDRRLRLWDVGRGDLVEELLRIDRGDFDRADFTSDGTSLFGGISFHSMKERWGDIFRWDHRSRSFVFRRRIHGFSTTTLVSSTDNRLLLTASWDKTACLLDAHTGDVLATLGHQATVFGADFSPDQTLVLTWSADKTARIWDCAPL